MFRGALTSSPLAQVMLSDTKFTPKLLEERKAYTKKSKTNPKHHSALTILGLEDFLKNQLCPPEVKIGPLGGPGTLQRMDTKLQGQF